MALRLAHELEQKRLFSLPLDMKMRPHDTHGVATLGFAGLPAPLLAPPLLTSLHPERERLKARRFSLAFSGVALSA